MKVKKSLFGLNFPSKPKYVGLPPDYEKVRKQLKKGRIMLSLAHTIHNYQAGLVMSGSHIGLTDDEFEEFEEKEEVPKHLELYLKVIQEYGIADENIGNIGCPVLVISGVLDDLVNIAKVDALAALLPNCTYYPISDMPHGMDEEFVKERLNPYILPFVDGFVT